METGSVVVASQSWKGRTLEALNALSFLPHDVKDLVGELRTLAMIYRTRVD